ncbi:MAG: LytR C-terminal domain-containing protein, partial [Candidatus Eiseniibacteriota bacterium]
MRVRPGSRSVRRPPARDGDESGAGGRWLLPALFTAVLLLGGSALWQYWWGARDSGPPQPRVLAGRSELTPVRIEVLNGSGEPGAAAKLASYLREGGFNV